MLPNMRNLLSCLLIFLSAMLPAEEVQVRILHTSDLHGNLQGGAEAPASLLQLSSEVKRVRAERPPHSVLLIDTGDTMQGSLPALLSQGIAPLAILQAMDCDAWIPGNHDFDYGFDAFLSAAEFMRPNILCGNLQPRSSAYANYPAWRLYDCNGARIAVIGATASYMHHWFLNFSLVFDLQSAVNMLRRILPEILSAKPDAIVLALHQGWLEQDARKVNEVQQISREFPEIDLILGAHTHRPFAGRSIGSHTWYVQPGAHGEFFSQVDLKIDTAKHIVTEISSKLVRVPRDAPKDPQAEAAIAQWLEQADVLAKEAVSAPLPGAISAKGRPGIGCAQSEMLCQAIAEASGCEIALHGILAKIPLEKGEVVTREKLFQIIPYENTIVTCELTPAELERILSEQWTLRKVYTFCGLWGATALVGEKHSRLLSIGISKEAVDPGKRYRVALNSHTAAGGGRTPVLTEILLNPAAHATDTGISTRKALEQWFRHHPDTVVTPQVWMKN